MEMGRENTRKMMKMMVDDGNGERKHKKNDENNGGNDEKEHKRKDRNDEVR